MKKTEYSIKQILSYIGIALISILLVIFFTATDIITSIITGGQDQHTIAKIDNEKIRSFDFQDYTRTYTNGKLDKKQVDSALNEYINMILENKQFQKDGYYISENRIGNFVRKLFADPKTGKLNKSAFKRFKQHTNYQKLFDIVLLNIDFKSHLRMGVATSQNEIDNEFKIQNSKIKIKYSFLSNKDLKRKHLNKIKASNKEIKTELSKLKDKKDLKKSRASIIKNIENKNLSLLKANITKDINVNAKKSGSFNKSASILKGTIKTTDVFQIGQTPKESGKKGKPLYQLSSATIYQNSLLNLKVGASSKAIQTTDGIYVITPLKKDVLDQKPSEEESKKIAMQLDYQKYRALQYNLATKLRTKSKIVKNLKK